MMPSRFVKSPDPSCDFIVRDRGTQMSPNHTVEVVATFLPDHVNEKGSSFGNHLMNHLPRGSWRYDGEASPKCFRLLPAVLDKAVEIARIYYRHVYKTEGARVENLVTGEVFEERSLFE